MMLGVARTSPAIASAMPNLCPGFIFVIAACLGSVLYRLNFY
jgi:hypothetical protein